MAVTIINHKLIVNLQHTIPGFPLLQEKNKRYDTSNTHTHTYTHTITVYPHFGSLTTISFVHFQFITKAILYQLDFLLLRVLQIPLRMKSLHCMTNAMKLIGWNTSLIGTPRTWNRTGDSPQGSVKLAYFHVSKWNSCLLKTWNTFLTLS